MAADPAFIGRYEIQGILGRGSMGTIYRAHDPDIDRPLAIKLIRADLLDGDEREDFITRFRREAQAVGRCVHPNIVAVYDFALHQGNPFLAMEFVDGVTLAQAIRAAKQMPLEDVVFLILQVLDALQAVHALDIVHRDIKPANIMISGGTKVKLADFGISKISTAALTGGQMVIGTPNYMSPEQWRGTGVDARSDLFSVGVVMYELLSGAKPFEGRHAEEIFSRLIQGPAPDIASACPGLPRPVCDVINRSLVKTPADRFSSAADMARALRVSATEAGTEFQNRTVVMPQRQAGTPVERDAAPGSLGAFDADTLDTLRRRLAEYVGPIAKHLVTNAVRSSASVDALCASLAKQIDRESDRAKFQQDMAKFFSGTRTTTARVATPASTLSPAEAERLTAAFARYVGPMARILIKRASAQAATRPELIQVLSDQIDDEAARAAFLEEAASAG